MFLKVKLSDIVVGPFSAEISIYWVAICVFDKGAWCRRHCLDFMSLTPSYLLQAGYQVHPRRACLTR